MSAVALAEPLTPEWHEQRRRGIGASEIAAVMGISPWESPFSLYWRKVNGWRLDLSAEMEWGTRLELAVAEKYADVHPDTFVSTHGIGENGRQFGGLVVGPEPWMLATPDRFICGACTHIGNMYNGACADCMNTGQAEPIMGVLELKTGHSAADGWGDHGSDDIPVHYRAQVQWQMLCCGLDVAEVAVLIGGSDYREYRLRRDERDIRTMVEYGRRFMARLEAGDPPPLDDHTATLATVKRLHPDLTDDTATVPDAVANGYLRAVRMLRIAQRAVDRYEIQVRDHVGPAKRIESTDGRKVATHVITDVAESTVTRSAHRRDYLLPPRERKQ